MLLALLLALLANWQCFNVETDRVNPYGKVEYFSIYKKVGYSYPNKQRRK